MVCRAALPAFFAVASFAQGLPKVTFEVENLEGGGGGKFTIMVHPEWAPSGAARFTELVHSNFFSAVYFHRTVKDFVAQFGINGDPSVSNTWNRRTLQDDKVRAENTRGRLSFASSGPNSRTTQIFINYQDNKFLDSQGFAPFAEVIDGMDVVDSLFGDYGDVFPGGQGPDQARIQGEGNNYLIENFPKLSRVKYAWVDSEDLPASPKAEADSLPSSPDAGSRFPASDIPRKLSSENLVSTDQHI